MKKSTNSSSHSSLTSKLLWYGFVVLLIAMPFHAFLTIILGNTFGYRAVFQAWKEVLAVAMFVVWFYDVFRRRSFNLRKDVSNVCVALIFLVALTVSLFNAPSLSPFLFGVKADLMPLILFIMAQSIRPLPKQLSLDKLILVPAAIVLIGGVLQAYFLPVEVLVQLGYNANTIVPLQLVDPAISSVRLFSTLGGANQLGAYLILPICLCVALILRKRVYYAIPLLLGLGWLIFRSYSRSSWIGLVIALFVTILISLQGMVRKAFIVLSIIGIIAGGVFVNSVITSPENSRLQYILLHGRVNENKVEGSDAARSQSQQAAIKKMSDRPLGYGLGVAGPASQHAGQGIVTENWYLQIGLEMGIIGLILFVVFWLANAGELFVSLRSNGADPLRIALFASLLGLMATNLFLHSWADSTLSIMMLSLLGLTKETKS